MKPRNDKKNERVPCYECIGMMLFRHGFKNGRKPEYKCHGYSFTQMISKEEAKKLEMAGKLQMFNDNSNEDHPKDDYDVEIVSTHCIFGRSSYTSSMRRQGICPSSRKAISSNNAADSSLFGKLNKDLTELEKEWKELHHEALRELEESKRSDSHDRSDRTNILSFTQNLYTYEDFKNGVDNIPECMGRIADTGIGMIKDFKFENGKAAGYKLANQMDKNLDIVYKKIKEGIEGILSR